jgi:hypothetical protein
MIRTRPAVATTLAGLALTGLALTACAAGPPAAPGGAVPAAGHNPGCTPYTRTELFFGTSRAGGPAISETEFEGFLDSEVTPRFPDGLTVLTGRGQFRGADGRLVEERSIVLVLLYPTVPAGDGGAKVDQIRELYKQKFNQESVLRADSDPTCVSF